MKILRASAILFSLTLTLMAQIAIAWAEGDEFYPSEEATERSTIVWPRLVELHTNSAVLEWPGEPPHTLPVGERYRDYELLAVIPQPTPLAVIERSFPRWGVLAYVGTKGPVASMRKAVGSLGSIRPLKAFPPDYFERILNAQEDILGKEATSKGDEPSYESLAGLLPPLLGYTFLGTTTSSQKMIVWPDGRLGYGVGRDRKMSKAVFDPTEALHILNSRSSATKQGLIGRYLPVIDYGFYDTASHRGWEEIAFAIGAEELQTYVCLRSNDGKRTYWRLPGQQPLQDGTDFYRALLAEQEEWEKFFAEGMRLEVPEARVNDSARASIVRAVISEIGNHPKCGVGVYWGTEHDTFPPPTILLNLCLLDWGFSGEVKARLSYYLSHYVKPDGTFDYYGPAISEYGQMLTVAARYVQVRGDTNWFLENLPALRRITESLVAQILASRKRDPPDSPDYGLLYGSAEADTRKDKRFYFSGDVWCWRGLEEMGHLLNEVGQREGDAALGQFGENLLEEADSFQGVVLAAMCRAFQNDATPPFLPPDAGTEKPFENMTENEFATYTNYRYWPEMLSAGMLPPELQDAIITYRTARGGEVAATTRLEDVMDDWPYANYAWGLMEAGQIEHFLLGFYGHLAFHETPGTFNAYESVNIKGDSKRTYASDYCVAAQVVEPQMLRWMIAWEPWENQELWLARAVPKKWLDTGFSATHIPTRWGPVNFAMVPNAKSLTARVEIAPAHPELRVHICFRQTVAGSAPHVTVEGTKNWKWDAVHQAVELSGPWNKVTVIVDR